ncbi:MAG: phage tail assembly protein [Bacteroidales bacterium]
MKTKIIKTENTLKVNEVTLREPLAEDILEAQKFAGDGDAAVTLALLSQICQFDGKRLTVEDLRKMPMRDFLGLSSALEATGWMASQQA